MDQSTGISKMVSNLGVVPAKPLVVAVDGPAGSGKSTVCQKVCQLLGWAYVNTGSIYRAVALLAEEQGVDLKNTEKMKSLVNQLEAQGRWDAAEGRLHIEGRDVTSLLSGTERGRQASRIATHPQIREALLPVFRTLVMKSEASGALVDGRDIGSVVFPEADLKIYMTASLEVRAKRRMCQLKAQESELSHIQEQMRLRDEQDQSRAVAPLIQAEGAVLFDTTDMGEEAVATELQALIEKKLLIELH
ncbi:MAG: (d)CMP kinase [Oligoflexales bacterium]